ncbi:unnamed protein product [Caenorhabditis nigoni]
MGVDQYEYYLSNKRSQDAIDLRKRRIPYPLIDHSGLVSPNYDHVQVALEKLIFDRIKSRPMIHTKRLEFWNRWNFRIPVDLKIQAEIIEAADWINFSYRDLDRISNYLGPKPLKEFSTKLDNYEIFTHPIVRNSQKLVLRIGSEYFSHRRINHRNIHLKGYYRPVLMIYMNAWIANGPEIGMEFSGDIEKPFFWELVEEEISIKEMMYLRKCESGGGRLKPDERFRNTVYSISLPRTNNPNTEIQMSLFKNKSNNSWFQIHLKVQPSGTAIPEQSDSMYWELKLLKIRKVCTFETFLTVMIVLLVLPFLCILLMLFLASLYGLFSGTLNI